MKVIEFSFFSKAPSAFAPTPAEIRAINTASGNSRGISFNRPLPVIIPSLGLLVEYRGYITIFEVQTQIMIRDRLEGQVPVPEVFGWREDADQRFIYMALVNGETLE